MLGDDIVLGTTGRSDTRRRLFLFDRRALMKCFEESSREEITEALWTIGHDKGIFNQRLLGCVIAQISYSLNPDKKTWRVSSVSSSRPGYGTQVYQIAMADVYPLYLTPDSSPTQIGSGPRRIWEKISHMFGVEWIFRISWPDSMVNEPAYLNRGYRLNAKHGFEEINLLRLNKYTVRLWEETDDLTGAISKLFHNLGFRHFTSVYIDD